MFALLGSEVTLVEMLPTVVPNEDAEVSAALRKILVQQGVTVRDGTRIEAIAEREGGLRVSLSKEDEIARGGRHPRA